MVGGLVFCVSLFLYIEINWTLVDKNLLIQALAKFFLGVILLGLLIFLPAWSVHYWQGWLTSR